MPAVSVVLPAYDPRGTLERAVESVLAQSMDDLELIVVDDGSPTDLSWVDRHPDRRVRRHVQANRGVSVARNVGVALAAAEHIAFIDQDDEWLPGKLDRQLAAFAAQPEASFCCTNFDWVTGDTVQPGAPQRISRMGLLSDQHVCLSSVVVRRDHYVAVGGHDPALAMMQDWDLFLRLTLTFGDPLSIQERLVRYHLHGANASKDYRAAARERFAVLAVHEARAQRLGDRAELDAIARGRRRTGELYGYQAVDAARAAVRARQWRSGAGHLATAVRLDPSVVGGAARSAVKSRVGARPAVD